MELKVVSKNLGQREIPKVAHQLILFGNIHCVLLSNGKALLEMANQTVPLSHVYREIHLVVDSYGRVVAERKRPGYPLRKLYSNAQPVH